MTEKSNDKKTRHRSPNHPSLTLENAIERAGKIYSDYKKHEVDYVKACEKIGFSNHKSSNAGSAISSLVYYGLLRSEGRGDKRKVSITETGERIVREAPDAETLKRDAALKPPIHREIYDTFVKDGELAHDDIVRQYLEWDREAGTFNEKSIGPFLEQIKKTFSYVKLVGSEEVFYIDPKNDPEGDEDIPNNGNGDSDDSGSPEIKVGSIVQWRSESGELQFEKPYEITRIDERDGERFAFFEAKGGHAPMSELVLADAAKSEDATITPIVPTQHSSVWNPATAIREETSLDEGQVTLVWPAELSMASVVDFEYWVNGLIKKARRRAKHLESKEVFYQKIVEESRQTD